MRFPAPIQLSPNALLKATEYVRAANTVPETEGQLPSDPAIAVAASAELQHLALGHSSETGGSGKAPDDRRLNLAQVALLAAQSSQRKSQPNAALLDYLQDAAAQLQSRASYGSVGDFLSIKAAFCGLGSAGPKLAATVLDEATPQLLAALQADRSPDELAALVEAFEALAQRGGDSDRLIAKPLLERIQGLAGDPRFSVARAAACRLLFASKEPEIQALAREQLTLFLAEERAQMSERLPGEASSDQDLRRYAVVAEALGSDRASNVLFFEIPGFLQAVRDLDEPSSQAELKFLAEASERFIRELSTRFSDPTLAPQTHARAFEMGVALALRQHGGPHFEPLAALLAIEARRARGALEEVADQIEANVLTQPAQLSAVLFEKARRLIEKGRAEEATELGTNAMAGGGPQLAEALRLLRDVKDGVELDPVQTQKLQHTLQTALQQAPEGRLLEYARLISDIGAELPGQCEHFVAQGLRFRAQSSTVVAAFCMLAGAIPGNQEHNTIRYYLLQAVSQECKRPWSDLDPELLIADVAALSRHPRNAALAGMLWARLLEEPEGRRRLALALESMGPGVDRPRIAADLLSRAQTTEELGDLLIALAGVPDAAQVTMMYARAFAQKALAEVGLPSGAMQTRMFELATAIRRLLEHGRPAEERETPRPVDPPKPQGSVIQPGTGALQALAPFCDDDEPLAPPVTQRRRAISPNFDDE